MKVRDALEVHLRYEPRKGGRSRIKHLRGLEQPQYRLRGEEIVITRHGRPAGVLIGLESEEDWFEYRLEHHPDFLAQIREARAAIAAALGDPAGGLGRVARGAV